MPLLSSGERNVLIETIRALGRIGDAAAVEPLLRLIGDAAADPHVRLEAVGALGGFHQPEVGDALLDLLADPSPAIRAAALRSLATFDPEGFVIAVVGARSRSALERARGAGDGPRHAAAGKRLAAPRGDARTTPISAWFRS